MSTWKCLNFPAAPSRVVWTPGAAIIMQSDVVGPHLPSRGKGQVFQPGGRILVDKIKSRQYFISGNEIACRYDALVSVYQFIFSSLPLPNMQIFYIEQLFVTCVTLLESQL